MRASVVGDIDGMVRGDRIGWRSMSFGSPIARARNRALRWLRQWGAVVPLLVAEFILWTGFGALLPVMPLYFAATSLDLPFYVGAAVVTSLLGVTLLVGGSRLRAMRPSTAIVRRDAVA
jgi:hypothetical protein